MVAYILWENQPRPVQETSHEQNAADASTGERVLALAQCSVPPGTTALKLSDIAPRFDLLGLVGIIDPPREEVIQSYCAKAREQAMQQFISALGATVSPLSDMIEFGPAPAVIRGKAEALQPDLIVIVMGKHGQSVWEDMLLGSVAKHVMREVGCDVLVVST